MSSLNLELSNNGDAPMKTEQEDLASIGLDELVESRLSELIRSLSAGGSARDIEPELISLAKLIDEYSLKDELLENLLDPVTTTAERQQIRDELKFLERNQVELERLHTNARDLLRSSIHSLLRSKKKIYERHNGPEYSLELCGYCKGFARLSRLTCPACAGQRFVCVHQPATACPRCKGSGKADAHELFTFDKDLCIVCRGKGWAFTRRNRTSTED